MSEANLDRVSQLEVPQEQGASKKTIRKVMFASISGTVIEWYDYSLYGAAAGLVINKLYFPNLSPTIATLAAFFNLCGRLCLSSARGRDYRAYW